jgi:SanA protein
MPLPRWLAGGIFAAILLPILPVTAAVWWVHCRASGRVIGSSADLPRNDVCLVLGTSPLTSGGRSHNAHFEHRMAAAAELYAQGRVRQLLLSGNGAPGDEEPKAMRAAMLALGVPGGALFLDQAGFRTLDSMARAREVFGVKKLTIVTDRFHCYRAIFLARAFGLDAVAFPSAEVTVRRSFKTRVRECLADVKACLDVYVLRTRPKLLGPVTPIPPP